METKTVKSLEMRIALCFWGLCRSTDRILKSYEENVLQPLLEAGHQVDVYLHTYKLYRSYTNIRANEINVQLKNTNFKLLKPRLYMIEDQDEIDKEIGLNRFRQKGDPWENDRKSQKEAWSTLDNHLRALWSLRIVTSIWQQQSIEYDRVIYLRPDVSFKTKFNVEWLEAVRKGTVFIPDFHIYFGSNDRFALGLPSDMAIYGNRFEWALEYSKQKPLHSEAFLTDTLTSRGIKMECIPFRFQRVRANGVVCEADREVF